MLLLTPRSWKLPWTGPPPAPGCTGWPGPALALLCAVCNKQNITIIIVITWCLWMTTVDNLLPHLGNFIYLFLCTRWLQAWSRCLPEVSMTSCKGICITVHVAYVTSARHHFATDKRIYSCKGFCFLWLYMQRKKRVQTILSNCLSLG